MSYAEAKQIAELRQELRACWDRRDHFGAVVALARLSQCSRDNYELSAEVKRWSFRVHGAV
jgi:hypothetical protein